MYKIVCKKELNSAVTYMEIEAPFVARKAKAGQFIIFRCRICIITSRFTATRRKSK